ncbi:uncharacterized protein An16g00640 [Aspergillus niger]|uniref:Contig An16c0020, genomic contig n=2 Tax=Aspergillus niger TaxID=5061 RepID=A2R6N6_ASPNC|nr:uncharacterized protein An16g00640 [Aspergillus niger]CAK46751.1 unnamed protein product [Aspergillus niger]
MADYVGNTPLHEVMKGTMLKRYDNNGNLDPTYPWDAPLRGRQQWIQVLVEAGGLMQQPNASGQTPAQLLSEVTRRHQCRRQVRASESPRGAANLRSR